MLIETLQLEGGFAIPDFNLIASDYSAVVQ
jgi:hypothetical protein